MAEPKYITSKDGTRLRVWGRLSYPGHYDLSVDVVDADGKEIKDYNDKIADYVKYWKYNEHPKDDSDLATKETAVITKVEAGTVIKPTEIVGVK